MVVWRGKWVGEVGGDGGASYSEISWALCVATVRPPMHSKHKIVPFSSSTVAFQDGRRRTLRCHWSSTKLSSNGKPGTVGRSDCSWWSALFWQPRVLLPLPLKESECEEEKEEKEGTGLGGIRVWGLGGRPSGSRYTLGLDNIHWIWHLREEEKLDFLLLPGSHNLIIISIIWSL